MNTEVGQGRQTPPTQVLGVMGCAVWSVVGVGREGVVPSQAVRAR